MPLPPDTFEFIRRWRDKRHHYNHDTLEDVFDRFFTSYVLYNFLYELVALREEYKSQGDRYAAIGVVRRYLGSDPLFADEILQRSARDIVDLIQDRTFYIRDIVWDLRQVAKLQTCDPEQWSEGLLEILYRIRCNTFHGQKRFDAAQRLILQPCITALDRLNDIITHQLEVQPCDGATASARDSLCDKPAVPPA